MKIFSNNQDNERLYTVLMNEDELRLYSEFQKEFNSKAAKERNKKFLKNISDRETKNDLYTGKFIELSDEKAKKSANKYNKSKLGKYNKWSPEDVKINRRRLNNNYLVNSEVNDPMFMKQEGNIFHNKRTIIENRQRKAKNEKLKKFQESITKHSEKADKLRKLKYKRQIARKIALGTAAGIGLAYGGKKLYDHYKKEA